LDNWFEKRRQQATAGLADERSLQTFYEQEFSSLLAAVDRGFCFTITLAFSMRQAFKMFTNTNYLNQPLTVGDVLKAYLTEKCAVSDPSQAYNYIRRWASW
jgi:hypothetical protein